MDTIKLQTVVQNLLAERFPEAIISRVVVQPDIDSDGDRILRITIVLASEPQQLNPLNLVSFPRLLRPRLAEEKAEAFPVVSFVAEKEARKLNLEAA